MTIFNQLFDQTTAALDSAEFLAQHINGNHDLTESGKDSQWEKYTTTHSEYVKYLTDTINQVRTAAAAEVADTRDAALPTAKSDNARMVAELTAQRLLNRGTLTNLESVNRWFGTEDISPARTVVVAELAARGIIEADHVDVLVKSASPSYDIALANQSQAETILVHLIQSKVNRLAGKLADRTKILLKDGLDIAAVQGRVDKIMRITGAPTSIKPFSPSMYERQLRQHG